MLEDILFVVKSPWISCAKIQWSNTSVGQISSTGGGPVRHHADYWVTTCDHLVIIPLTLRSQSRPTGVTGVLFWVFFLRCLLLWSINLDEMNDEINQSPVAPHHTSHLVFYVFTPPSYVAFAAWHTISGCFQRSFIDLISYFMKSFHLFFILGKTCVEAEWQREEMKMLTINLCLALTQNVFNDLALSLFST